MAHALLLARGTLIEARRSALPWLAAGGIAVTLGLATFLSQVAVTENRELQAAFSAALLRAAAAFLLAAHVATSVVREWNDKGLELALALPMSRTQYYFGKLAGFAACGACLAAACAIPLLLWASPLRVALWGLSLACELALVAAATLFFVISMLSALPAIAATAGLYLLSRAMAAIQSLARSPLAEETALQGMARGAVDTLALLLPRLDAATRADWLLYAAPGAAEYGMTIAVLLLYGAVLAAAGLFDFHRRNL